MKTILIATEKPFAKEAVEGIKNEVKKHSDYQAQFLENYTDKEELLKAVSSCDALIIRSDKVTQEVLDNASKLKIVVRAGAGYDNIDTQYAAQKNIVAMNTPGQNSNAVAELVFGLMVSAARNQYNGKAGTELKGKKLGIHAYGNIGKLVAKIAQGFEMEIYAYDITPDTSNSAVTFVDSEEELYSTCQYISLHIPAIKQTIKAINHKLLTQMPPNATLINTARKEVIDEEGLLKVLQERPDFKYISDIAPDNKNILLENHKEQCFFTPKKMGAQTAEANINAGIAAVKQIVNYFEKKDETYKVN